MNSQRGLTLIEVLAATMILGIVIISFSAVSNYTSQSDLRTDKSIVALSIAEKHLSLSRSNLEADPPNLPSASQADGDFTVTQQLQPLGNAPYNTTSPKHISVQAVVPIIPTTNSTPEPYVLTVTVGWP